MTAKDPAPTLCSCGMRQSYPVPHVHDMSIRERVMYEYFVHELKQIEQRARYKLLKEIADNCSWPFDTPSGEQSYEIVISRGEWELLMNKEQSGGGNV
jgi:hypothetical protein